MSYKLFTYFSYSPYYRFGYVSIDIYNQDELIKTDDVRIENINRFEIEQIGIEHCLDFISQNNITSCIIYSDCITSCNNPNIQFVKGDNLLDKKFKLVSRRSIKLLRRDIKTDII